MARDLNAAAIDGAQGLHAAASAGVTRWPDRPCAIGALTIGAIVSHGHVADAPTIAASVVAFAVVRRTGNLTYGL